MTKIEQLELLKTEVLSCKKCKLHETRTKVVFGEGNPNGGVLLIGEGPGADEDKTGRPFVGRSGQLLDKILEAAGFNRKDHVFIANIVKCRPPNNREPEKDEREACLPYLHKQIEIIDPKIIVLLGATALKLIDPSMRLKDAKGQWMIWKDKIVLTTYHPSALLRNPNLKKEAWEHFKKLFYKYREIINPEIKSEHIK